MREILFRAKTFADWQWVYGSYILVPEGKTQRHLIYDHRIILRGERQPEIRPETLCQYTGMKDRSGQKIFEGDIVETDLARPYLVVVFRDGAFMFNCNDGGKDYYDIMLPILEEEQNVYAFGCVIGNIHDNPRLLIKQ